MPLKPGERFEAILASCLLYYRFAPENQSKIDPYAFMPFGQGPRHCVAMRLAQLEIKMTMVKLLQKYRIFKTDKLQVNFILAPSVVMQNLTFVLAKARGGELKRIVTQSCR